MLFYALIGLCLALVGVTGLQFTYMFYLDRIDAERRKHIATLERKCRELTAQRDVVEQRIADIETAYPELKEREDWADVIEEL